MLKPKSRIKVIPLENLQYLAWQLQSLADQTDGPAKAVLERARDDITSIASEVYGD
jgi:hypothetical protein